MGSTRSSDDGHRYPPAPRLDLVEVLHGHPVADPYRWLEEAADSRTVAWSQAQDDLFAQARDTWPDRSWYRRRLEELLAVGSVNAPVWRGGRSFWQRRMPGQEHAVLMTAASDGRERILVDPIAMDPSGLTTLDFWYPSRGGTRLAYGVSTGGTEDAVLWVLDVATGEIVDGPIDRVRYSDVAWLADDEAFVYVRQLAPGDCPRGPQASAAAPGEASGAGPGGGAGNPAAEAAGEGDGAGDDAGAGEAAWRLYRSVYLHRIGSEADQDPIVFGADLVAGRYYSVTLSVDGRWLTIGQHQGTDPRNDLWIADIAATDLARGGAVLAEASLGPALDVVQEGVDARVGASVRGGRLYLWTDRDAPRGRICVADPTAPSFPYWQDLVPQDPDAVLEDFVILDGAELDRPVLIVAWSRHAVSELSVHDLGTGRRLGALPLPGLGSITELTTRPVGGHEAWFSYTDFATPATVYHYDARSGAVSLWARPPGAFTGTTPVTRQIPYLSPDGTAVRMFLIEPAGDPSSDPGGGTGPSDGSDHALRPSDSTADHHRPSPRPTILYGYGGFGIALRPAYSAATAAWIEAGGCYAVANLRGGGEEGEQWHRDGMLANKQRAFDDFHAASDWLVTAGVTTRDQLAIMGGSNGGLLVGAALTQSPDRYAAVVCSAPLLDMVRYEQFGLGSTWSGEYGTADDPEHLGWLIGYSPYHRVRRGEAYPAVLLTVFDGDTRVDTMHARKFVAALQHASTSERPILLRREIGVGHSQRSVSRAADLVADELAFLAAHLR